MQFTHDPCIVMFGELISKAENEGDNTGSNEMKDVIFYV